MNTRLLIERAKIHKKCIPAFNSPYLPMVKPIMDAIHDTNSPAIVQVARLEWVKMSAGSIAEIALEFFKYSDGKHHYLHLDHVPVIDEDGLRVDYLADISAAISAGYHSAMIDGSRLNLYENIRETAIAAELCRAAGIPIEAELGAVMGHEAKELPPYEEIFAAKSGFTRLDEAKIFAENSGCDWLSVAAGNIHGAISESLRGQKKPEARLDVAHIADLSAAASRPLVIHGGSGIRREFILRAIDGGVSKINVGTEIRQTYEFALNNGQNAQDAVYFAVTDYILDFLENGNLYDTLMGGDA